MLNYFENMAAAEDGLGWETVSDEDDLPPTPDGSLPNSPQPQDGGWHGGYTRVGICINSPPLCSAWYLK